MGGIKKDKYITQLIEVSDDFFNCYNNFNVFSQVEKMKTLSKKDLYLLLSVCLDRHEYMKDPIVKNNLLAFKDEMRDILAIHDGKKTNIPEIQELIDETGDNINTTRLGKNGSGLPDPKTRSEIRELKLDQIIKL